MSAPAFHAFCFGEERSDAFAALRGLADASPDPVAPGTECLLLTRDGAARARCTLFVADDMRGAAGRSGMVGHYEALDVGDGATLLAEACSRLARRGVARVLGPMNGSTWGRYRLALPRAADAHAADDDFFPGEPRNPSDYPGHFEAAGFQVVARYESRVEEDFSSDPPDAVALAERVRAAGVTFRPFDLARFDAELETILALSLEAFRDNLYYTPIAPAAFHAAYRALRERFDPELIPIALDRAGRPCGYVFAYAVSGAPAGRPRLIVKTLAVAPPARGGGLGHHLLDRMRSRARALGHASIVHALMQVENASMRISARQRSQVFRRYALYERQP